MNVIKLHPEVLPAGQLSLPELASAANAEHELCRRAGESMLDHALLCGDHLLAAKAQVRHGEWLPWLTDHFDGSERNAQNYMDLAANKGMLNPQNSADLSIDSALRELREIRRDIHTLKVMGSSASVEWPTPQEFFDLLDAEFGFEVDVCATQGLAKCARFFSPKDDGLAQEWRGTCWMNPPYGETIGEWMRKAWESGQAGATVVCLVPARVDTGWWWDYARQGEIRFLRGRLRTGTQSWPFPSAVVIFPSEPRVVWWERDV